MSRIISSTLIWINLLYMSYSTGMGFSHFSTSHQYPLHEATRSGDLVWVHHCVRKGCSINTYNADGRQPIHIAAMRGFDNILQFLIEQGAHVDASADDRSGYTPLHYAALCGTMNNIRSLLRGNPPPQLSDITKEGVPCYLNHKDRTSTCQILIDHGAHIDEIDHTTGTPLHTAILRGNHNMCQLLIEQGADVNMKRQFDDYTPTLLAARTGNTPLLATCIKYGGNITPHAESTISQAITKKSYALLDILLCNGLQTDHHHPTPGTPTCLAAYHSQPILLQKLLAHGIDTDYQTLPKNILYHLRITHAVSSHHRNADMQYLLYTILPYIYTILASTSMLQHVVSYIKLAIGQNCQKVADQLITQYLDPHKHHETYANIILHTIQLHVHKKPIFTNLINKLSSHYKRSLSSLISGAWKEACSGKLSTAVLMHLMQLYPKTHALPDHDGNSLLHRIAMRPNLIGCIPEATALTLQSKYATPHNNDGETPVMLARKHGNTRYIEHLKDMIHTRQLLSRPHRELQSSKDNPTYKQIVPDEIGWQIVSYLPFNKHHDDQ